MPAVKSFLNVRETALRLGVHENTVRNWADRGLLRAIRLRGSGYRRFSVHEIESARLEMLEGVGSLEPETATTHQP